MKNYKVKTKVKNNFNDIKTNITYEKDEEKKYVTEVVAEKVTFLSSKKADE